MRLSIVYKKIINKALMKMALSKLNVREKVIYLTFDDGPEEGITQFVLDELEKYGFKATFFCTGKNASSNPTLMKKIIDNGHSVANHTFSHLVAYNVTCNDYVEDIKKASNVIPSGLFRPPCGCLTVSSWLKLYRKYRIVYWSLNSGDSRMKNFDYKTSVKNLHKTKCGDIVLFHFCRLHENETRLLLPYYLEWLHENNFQSECIR